MKTKRCKIGVLLLLLLLPGCSRQPVEAQVYAMDTLMTIKLWGSHGETAVQDLSRLFQEQEAQLSVTRPGSLVDRLNGGQTVELPELHPSCVQLKASMQKSLYGVLLERYKKLLPVYESEMTGGSYISKGAKIGADVEIAPFCVIGADVAIGDHVTVSYTHLRAHET